MADLIQNVLALVVTLGVLVTIHEFGHFWVARRCGVKVLRFSVGFGKPLKIWKDRHDTEFAIAILPLGGFVKMLDGREAEVPEALKAQAFDQKPVGQRMAIAAAGPVANFLFAIAAYAILLFVGVTTVIPIVGDVKPGSVAADAGLPVDSEILAVDGETVSGWADVNFQLVERIGDTGSLSLTVLTGGQQKVFDLSVESWLSDAVEPNPLRALGIEPWRPDIRPVVLEVMPDSPAERAGLMPGDLITRINAVDIRLWRDFVDQVSEAPGQVLQVELSREGQIRQVELTPESRETEAGVRGFVGVSVSSPEWPETHQRVREYGPLEALWGGLGKTADMTGMILSSLKKMLVGLISVENLGGPITIAKAAGTSAEYGIESFLTFLAQLSVMLAVLNLLPIPVLDGGHLLYYSIEWIRGKPISEAGQVLGLKIGMVLLAGVMALAIVNDFARL